MVQVSDQDMNTHLAEISRVRAPQGTHQLTLPGPSHPPNLSQSPLLSRAGGCSAGLGKVMPTGEKQRVGPEGLGPVCEHVCKVDWLVSRGLSRLPATSQWMLGGYLSEASVCL